MQPTKVDSVAAAMISEVTFGSLYQEHHARVLAYFLRRFDRETAIDCAAEVFTVAWHRLDDLPDGDDAIRWIFGVCRNVARNQARSRRRFKRLVARLGSQVGEQPTPPDIEVVHSSERQRAIAALAKLRPADREILRLAAWEELPRSDIAEILGCSRHAVDQRIQRATKRLRREYGKQTAQQGELE